MRVAIAIIVKDEAADILPWICWYLNLNVSTIILYDDSSTDGTFELVTDASSITDIRLHRVTPSLDLYTFRQQQCYISTFAEYEDEFDWIGFLDADEYLALPDNQDLPHFLDRSDDVGAVAIHWCNYGSAGHVLKPNMPPFYAYNKHYSRGEDINRHVKTFVRPKRWIKQWHNPHFFDVEPFRYEDVSGRQVTWSAVRGITKDEAKWDGAKLMHYQCRSMEHFVERIRKRPDIPAHPSLWAAYDHADTEDNTPRRQLESVARLMHAVVQASVARVIGVCCVTLVDATRRSVPRPNFGASPFASSPDHAAVVPGHRFAASPPPNRSGGQARGPVRIQRLVTHFGGGLEALPASARIGPAARSGSRIVDRTIYGLFIPDLPTILFLFSASDTRDPLLIENEPRVCEMLAYEIVQAGEAGLVALRQPSTKMFLSCEPPEVNGILSASRQLVKDWEKFSLVDLEPVETALDEDPRITLIRAFACWDRDIGSFLSAYVDSEPNVLCSIFPVLLRLAAPAEQEKLKATCGATLRYIF